jgi:hypothetical protein
MKEEGFLNGAFNKVKSGDVEARWLINQAGFNVPDSQPATPVQRACIAFAIAAETKSSDPIHGPDETLIAEAMAAQTIGELKAVVAKAKAGK